MSGCPLACRILAIPWIAFRMIRAGRAWHIITSLELVLASAIAFAGWASLNGYGFAGVLVTHAQEYNTPSSMWSVIVLILAIWIALTFCTAIRRSRSLHRPADIETEGFCFSLPIAALLWAEIALVHVPSSFSGQYVDILPNLPIVLVYVGLIANIWLLLREPGPQKQDDNSSRWIPRWTRSRLLKGRDASPSALLTPLVIVAVGGGFFGYQNPMWIVTTLKPVISSLIVISGLMGFWFVASRVFSKYRVGDMGDPRGARTAMFSVGWSLAWSVLALGIITVLRTLSSSQLPDYALQNLGERVIQLLIMAVLILGAADMLATLEGLLVLTPKAQHLSTESSSQASDDIDLFFLERMPSWQTLAESLKSSLTMRPMGSRVTKSLQTPALTATRVQGIAFLALAVVVSGITFLWTGVSAYAHIVRVREYDVDFLVGAASSAAYILSTVLALYIVLRFQGFRCRCSAVLSSVGHSIVPLLLVTLIMNVLPASTVIQTSHILIPVALLWALSYLAIDIGSVLRPRSLPLVLVAILLAHAASGHLIQNAHLRLLCWARIPVAAVRDTIAGELDETTGNDVEHAILQMNNVDLVDVKVSDLIDQVTYTRKLARRYYGNGDTEVISPVRIRGEVTANAGWMRRLCPVMARLTRSSKTPDDAVRAVSRWLRTELVEITPVVYPMGDKFDQDPITTLKCRRGNELDAAILMVAALRASGVAARVTPVYPDQFVNRSYSLAEYYDGTRWRPCYPTAGKIAVQQVMPEDLEKFRYWARSIQAMTGDLSLYVLVNSAWCPYNTGDRNEPARFGFDLGPGTYLAQYSIGGKCCLKQFSLRPQPCCPADYTATGCASARAKKKGAPGS